MAELSEFNRYGEEIERLLLLRTPPIAVRMLERESNIPEGALKLKRDRGYYLAQCQAFSLSRRQRNITIFDKKSVVPDTKPRLLRFSY